MKLRRAPSHPGGILKRLYLAPLDLSTIEFAKAIGVSRKTISKLINERGGITPEMALRLSLAFKTTPQLWLNLQQTKTVQPQRQREARLIAQINQRRHELVPRADEREDRDRGKRRRDVGKDDVVPALHRVEPVETSGFLKLLRNGAHVLRHQEN